MAQINCKSAILAALILAAAPSALAADTVLEDTKVQTEVRSYKGGKTMENIIAESKTGFETAFTDDEMMDVMKASHDLKESDWKLSKRLEKIGVKMSKYIDKKAEKKAS